jgi:general secretion pathway protein J
MRARGFTLVEVLIALTVFAFVSGAAVGVINLATNSDERLETINRELGQLERTRSIIRNDLAQIVERPYRVPTLSGSVATMLGGDRAGQILPAEDGEEILLAFVRTGWANPQARDPRPSVQQVTYLRRDGQLIRRTRPYIDAVEDTPVRDQVLLAEAETLVIRYRYGTQWTDRWQGGDQGQLPAAIRFAHTDPSYGPLTHDFLVGPR